MSNSKWVVWLFLFLMSSGCDTQTELEKTKEAQPEEVAPTIEPVTQVPPTPEITTTYLYCAKDSEHKDFYLEYLGAEWILVELNKIGEEFTESRYLPYKKGYEDVLVEQDNQDSARPDCNNKFRGNAPFCKKADDGHWYYLNFPYAYAHRDVPTSVSDDGEWFVTFDTELAIHRKTLTATKRTFEYAKKNKRHPRWNCEIIDESTFDENSMFLENLVQKHVDKINALWRQGGRKI